MHLADLLKRCLALTEVSEDAIYASSGVVEILSVLQKGINAIEQGVIPDKKELTILFAPTGDLQETAMANGWAEEYLKLSAKFDDLII
jgi:hypothetical protein